MLSYGEPNRVKRVTREITNKLREKDPNLKFRDITESVKKDCLENVNKQMVEQGCPEVTRAIVDWRVAKALAISRSHGLCILSPLHSAH